MNSAKPRIPSISIEQQHQKLLDTAARSRSGLFIYTILWMAVTQADGYAWRHPWLVGLNAAGLLLAAVGRYVIYRRISADIRHDFERTRRVFRFASWAYQGYWGILCAVISASPDAPILQWLMLMVTVALTCGGAAVMAIDIGLARAYPLLLTGPTALILLAHGGLASYTQAACFLALLAYTMKMSTAVGRDYGDKLQVQAALEQRARELEKAHEEMHRLATHDELTGLFNRRQLMLALAEHAALSRRKMVTFSLAIFDLDHFKRVNDTWGHVAGDDVLRTFAQEARRVLRETDLIGRWGGEEFLVLMPCLPPGTAITGIDRLRAALAKLPVSPVAPDLRVTFSAGITAFRPDDTIEAAIERADAALYAAKAAGRNRSVETD